jgi:hypothetical protein
LKLFYPCLISDNGTVMYQFQEALAALIRLYGIDEEVDLPAGQVAHLIVKEVDRWKGSIVPKELLEDTFADSDNTADSDALASAGFGTDEDYGGDVERL